MQAMQPSRELLILREKVQRFLEKDVDEFRIVDDRYEVAYQQTRVAIHPIDWTTQRTLLRVLAPIVIDVKPSPQLYERLSELNNTTIFGKYYVLENTIYIEHNLLGESLDREAFRATLASVAHHADHLVPALIAEFGGHTWSQHDG